jgi:hypothetical protein
MVVQPEESVTPRDVEPRVGKNLQPTHRRIVVLVELGHHAEQAAPAELLELLHGGF